MAAPVDLLCINTLRFLAVDTVQRANNGHPRPPLGAAAVAHALWICHLKHHPANPHWPDHDGFVLSTGQGSALRYSLLHATGYDLKQSCQRGSEPAGDPATFTALQLALERGCKALRFGVVNVEFDAEWHIPHHDGVAIPLEDPRILSQQ